MKNKKCIYICFFCGILLWVSGCAHIERRPGIGWKEVGTASWYGEDFHGKATSSGEVYNMYGLSAAHKTLPLGTTVKVSNLTNGKCVIVPINDRGPFVGDRIIDMSYGAAKDLGMVETGLAKVRIEVIRVPRYFENRYTIQVGAYTESSNAQTMAATIRKMGYDPDIEEVTVHDKLFYRVRVGKFDSIEKAEKMSRQFESAGIKGIVMAL